MRDKFHHAGRAGCYAVRIGVLLALALPASAASPGDPVAQLGTTRFLAGDLKGFVNAMSPELRHQALADPQTMNRLIQLEIVRKALLNEAIAKNWQSQPAVVKQIETARNTAILSSYLASVAALPNNYPAEAEIKAAYEQNRDKFLVPRQYRLGQIFIASAKGDANAAVAEKKVNELAAKAHAPGASFADLARKSSQHKPSADKGGDEGWVTEGVILPEIRAKIAGMAKGEVSDPIRSSQGWHIVRLLDTKPASVLPLDQVRASIVTSLRQKKQAEAEQQYIAGMLQKMTLNQARLRTALETTQ
jgi:peptidylprolyl isomerase